MGIIFKKNGRPTKAEKSLLKNINSFLGSLNESDKEKYNETVTSGDRLSAIWNNLTNPESVMGTGTIGESTTYVERHNKKDGTKERFTVEEYEKKFVDPDTGEIKEEEIIDKKEEEITEQTQEETNFVKEKKMEDVNIIEEINDGESAEIVNEVPSFFNPLAEPIKQRSYNTSSQTDVGEIEEPDFSNNESAKERLDNIEEEKSSSFEEEVIEEEEEEKHSEWDNVSNEAMEELPDKDKKLAAKQLVQTVLDGYEMLHELGKNFVKYPEEKLQEKIIKGEIDPTMEIPLDEVGTTTNPVEFFQNFNEQAEEAISYDPEFGEKVRPAMERVFSKKGWGMTDEQYLLVAFGKDAAWKGVQIMTLKKTATGIMNNFEKLQSDKNDAIRASKRERRTAEPSIQPDSIVTPPRRNRGEYEKRDVYEAKTYSEDSSYVKEDIADEEENSNSNNETGIVPIH